MTSYHDAQRLQRCEQEILQLKDDLAKLVLLVDRKADKPGRKPQDKAA